MLENNYDDILVFKKERTTPHLSPCKLKTTNKRNRITLLVIVNHFFTYLINKSSLYFGSVHIWLSTISSSLSI